MFPAAQVAYNDMEIRSQVVPAYFTACLTEAYHTVGGARLGCWQVGRLAPHVTASILPAAHTRCYPPGLLLPLLPACLQGVIPAEGHPHDGAHLWLKSALLLGQPCTLEQVGGGCIRALGLLPCLGSLDLPRYSLDLYLQAVSASGCCCCLACCSSG